MAFVFEQQRLIHPLSNSLGPAHYHTHTPLKTKASSTPFGVSSVNKLPLSDTPGPGAYDICKEICKVQLIITKNKQGTLQIVNKPVSSAAFLSRTNRSATKTVDNSRMYYPKSFTYEKKVYPLHKYKGIAKYRRPFVPKNLQISSSNQKLRRTEIQSSKLRRRNAKSDKKNGKVHQRSQSPGPGHYQVQCKRQTQKNYVAFLSSQTKHKPQFQQRQEPAPRPEIKDQVVQLQSFEDQLKIIQDNQTNWKSYQNPPTLVKSTISRQTTRKFKPSSHAFMSGVARFSIPAYREQIILLQPQIQQFFHQNKVPFNSNVPRFYNPEEKSSPAPGQYSYENDLIADQAIRKIKTGYRGMFGSTQKRFFQLPQQYSQYQYIEPDQEIQQEKQSPIVASAPRLALWDIRPGPGPGTYQLQRTQQDDNYGKRYAFSSTAERWVQNKPDQGYNFTRAQLIREKIERAKKQREEKQQKYLKSLKKQSIPATASKEEEEGSPGPGQYQTLKSWILPSYNKKFNSQLKRKQRIARRESRQKIQGNQQLFLGDLKI